MNTCAYCHKQLLSYQMKYCSNRCQADMQYTKYIADWQRGLKSGEKGINAKNTSGYVKRYLMSKFGDKCYLCGWNQRNPFTQKIPLEIDHIDGNSSNNQEENLRLLCPNCHSLSPNFRNLNKGRGRLWRKSKYLKNIIKSG